MPVGHSPLFRRRRLGEELRDLREAKGLKLQALAAELGWSHTKLSRLENAKVRPDVADVMDLLEALGVEPAQEQRLITLARQANQRGWWKAYAEMPQRQAGYAELEAGAREIWQYSLAFVPGLLQTEAYARVRFADREATAQFDTNDAVAGRQARQRILSADEAVNFTVVLDEALLRRVTAPADVWRGQLEHLVAAAGWPNVTVRVLPFGAELPHHAAALTGFSLYRFRDPNDPDVVCVETETSELQLGDEEDVARYRVMRDRLLTAALGPEDSIALIQERMT
ncbi:helix-turn-helix transcriptional regulator [Luedemannella flava]|uniref:Helix-turn-helix transcriptional regulator n=1 Tax=Luedemannella flava TaxID=349316 RepID=A0ABP4Y0B9_9ACTN